MSDEAEIRRNSALDFLDELDGRHDFLLNELEQLNTRIDAVLTEYTKSRQTAAVENGAKVDRSLEVAVASNASDSGESSDEAADFE